MPIKPRKPARTAAAKARRAAFTPAAPRARQDGWTRARQMAFIEALAESACVDEACRAVGMGRASAYRLRARVDAQGFRLAWDKALDYGVRRLSDACFSRALHGEAQPIFYQGQQVGERRRYDNRLAMFLLRYRDPLRYAATLDQMVYSGHTEGSALGLAKALYRVADEADGIADTGIFDEDPDERPQTETIGRAKAKAREAAIIEGTGPIHGTSERRYRLEALRGAHHAKMAASAPAPGMTSEEAIAALNKALWRGGSRGDVASPLSPSGADSED